MGNNVSTPLNDRLGIPRLTPQQMSQGVYMGTKYGYQAGAEQPVTVISDEFVPIEEAYGAFGSLSPEGYKELVNIMNVKAGSRSWNPEELPKLLNQGIIAANYKVRNTGQRVTALEVLRDFYIGGGDAVGLDREKKSGGAGAYTGPVTQTRLTDPTTAESLLDTSLKNYLGRAATKKEKSEFVRALNKYEAENPTVTTPMGPGGSVTTGGAQPTVFAEQFAQAQEGAAEYGAATTYFDAFLGALGNPVG